MRDINNLDIVGLSNLGIGFETDEEMHEFAEVIKNALELRVGDAMTKIMSPKQINEFESVMGTGEHKTATWLNKNCPQHKEICRKVRYELKSELLKYRDEIPGFAPSLIERWNGHRVDECEDLTLGDFSRFKKSGIETFGEMYSLGEEEICEILKLPPNQIGRAIQIKNIFIESRRKAEVPLEVPHDAFEDIDDEWIDDYEAYNDEDFLMCDCDEEIPFDSGEYRKRISDFNPKVV